MIKTMGIKGRMNLKEVIQRGGRSLTAIERSKIQPRDQLRLLCTGRNLFRINRAPVRVQPVRIRVSRP